MTPLLFLDTETTGLIPGRHTPWEIAWQICFAGDGKLKVDRLLGAAFFVSLAEKQNTDADEIALKIGKFDERYKISKALDPEQILDILKTDIGIAQAIWGGKGPIHLVGAVPSFDHAMIAQNWTGWPGFGEGLWHYHLVDVEAVMAGRLSVPPPWNSHELSAALCVNHDRSKMHTAMGDVEWAIDCYAAAMGLEVEGRTW